VHAAGTLPRPRINNWLGDQSDAGTKESVIMDFPTAFTVSSIAIVRQEFRGIVAFSRAMLSTANKHDRRTRYVCITDGIKDLEASVVVHTTRVIPRIDVISHTGLLADYCARVLDLKGPECIATHPELYEQGILLGIRRASVITNSPKTTWKEVLTSQAEMDYEERILKLSWMRNCRGGPQWAGLWPG
jgi:hypothetical protein